jgi:FkbM family methyltransferase
MDIIQALKSTDNPMIVEHLIALFYQMYPNMKFLIDAGANQGFHFSRMNKLPHLNLCVGVEANPDHIARLESLVVANKSLVIPKALVGSNFRDNEITFKVNKDFHGRGGVKGSHIWAIIEPNLQFTELTVQTVQLDSLISDFFPEKLDFVKMDLEGSELGILLHSSKVYEMNCIIVMENSVHFPKLYEITKEDWLKFVDSKNYFLVDFNFEPCVSETLFNYNHAFLVPKAKYTIARDIFLKCAHSLYYN